MDQANDVDHGQVMPSDAGFCSEEIMLFADGELDADREAQVLRHVQRDSRATAMLANVLVMGECVREVADSRARDSGADDIAAMVMARIAQDRALRVAPKRTAARRLVSVVPVAIGGLALAAAVALLVWRVGGEGWMQSVSVGGLVNSTGVLERAVASASLPKLYRDHLPSVSVDAVDFGARMGTVFYVPSDTGTTTVVWLANDEAGGIP